MATRITKTKRRPTGLETVVTPAYGKVGKSASTSAQVLKEDISKEELIIKGSLKLESCSKTKKAALCVQYTTEGEFLSVGLCNGEIHLLNVETGNFDVVLSYSHQKEAPPVTMIKHRPSTIQGSHMPALLATYVNGAVKCLNYWDRSCLYTIFEDRQTFGVAYHHSVSKFLTFGDDACLNLYNEETYSEEMSFKASDMPHAMDGHMSRIFSACFHPTSNYEFVSGGWDDTVQFWDTRQRYSTRHLFGCHVCGDGIDISKSGKEILTCSWQKTSQIQLWDYGSGKMICEISPDLLQSRLYCGKWISKDVIITGGSDPHLFRVIDQHAMSNIGTLRNLPGGVYSVDFIAKKRPSSARINCKIAICSANRLFELETK